MSVNLILAKKKLVFEYFVKIIFSLGFIGLIFAIGNLDAGYEVGKTVWLQWWVKFLTLGLWGKIILNPQHAELKFFSKKISFSLGLLLLIVFLAAALGVNWPQSWFGNYYRGDGLITWIHLVALSFLSSWLLSKDAVKILLPTAAITAGVILIIRIYLPTFFNLLVIGFGNNNINAGFLVVITPLVMFGLRKLHWSMSWFACVVLLITAVYLQAWGAVLSLGLFLLMRWWLKDQRRRKWVIALPAIVLFGGLLGVMSWQPANNSNYTESRSRLIHKLMLAVGKRPALGWGWANVDTAFESVDWPIAVGHEVYVDKAHSELLEMIVVSGIFGLGAYLLFLGFSYREIIISNRLKSDWGQALFLVCLLYFFHSQTNIVSVAESAVFWISLGSLLGNFD